MTAPSNGLPGGLDAPKKPVRAEKRVTATDPLEKAVDAFEGNTCMEAMRYRQSDGQCQDVRLLAFKEDVQWYRLHSEDMVQRASNDISRIENPEYYTTPAAQGRRAQR